MSHEQKGPEVSTYPSHDSAPPGYIQPQQQYVHQQYPSQPQSPAPYMQAPMHQQQPMQSFMSHPQQPVMMQQQPVMMQQQPVMMQQHPVMMQQQQQPQNFSRTTPIGNLNAGPAPVLCPACGQQSMTSTQFVAGGTTHAWALGLFLFTLLCCIPYLINGTKDVVHRCGKCGAQLATWHRSGRVEQHIFS